MTAVPEGLDPRASGQLIRAARKALGLTQDQVAESVGIPSQTYLSALENGRYSVGNSEYFPALASLLRLSVEQVRSISPHAVVNVVEGGAPDSLRLKPVSDLTRVPVVGFAAAGQGVEVDLFQTPLGHDYVRPDLMRPGLLVLQVDGDSMSRSGAVNSIESGDWIYLDTHDMQLQDGRIYVADVEGQGVVVKRARNWGGTWVLVSDNTSHPPISCDMARVVGPVYYRQPQGERL